MMYCILAFTKGLLVLKPFHQQSYMAASLAQLIRELSPSQGEVTSG